MSDWKKIEGVVIPDAVIEKHEAEADAARLKRIAGLQKELADLEAKAPAKKKP